MTYTFWDRETSLTFSSGKHTPEEVYDRFPLMRGATAVVLEKQGDVVVGIDSLDILRQCFRAPEEMTNEEALAYILDLKANPPEPQDGAAAVGRLEEELETEKEKVAQLESANSDIMDALVELAGMVAGGVQ